MDLKPCHRTLCIALKHNSIFTSHGELLSSGHLSRSNTQFQHLTNSLPKFRTALCSLPPHPHHDSCPQICPLATAMVLFLLQSRTALLPRRPPAERWHYSHCCSGCSSLAPFTSLTVDFDCSVGLYFHFSPQALSQLSPEEEGLFIVPLLTSTSKD